MKNQVAIKPLYDDVSMKKKTLFQRIVIKLIGDIYLSRSLKKQLAMRPETWGLGLWPDEETKKVAIICAEHLSANYGCPDDKLIPEDSMGLIAAVDPLCDFDDYAVVDVESEFECELDPALFRQGTFRDLVDAVVKARNTVHT